MNYLDRIQQQGRDANPFFIQMGIEIVQFGNGIAELSMEVMPGMLNGEGWMQGGLFTAVCDEAMALALFTVLDEDDSIATISESTSYLQGIRGGRIIAKGRLIKKERSIAFMEGYVMKADDEGYLLSKTTASFAIVRKSKT